jgi:hypothetical protein
LEEGDRTNRSNVRLCAHVREETKARQQVEEGERRKLGFLAPHWAKHLSEISEWSPLQDSVVLFYRKQA